MLFCKKFTKVCQKILRTTLFCMEKLMNFDRKYLAIGIDWHVHTYMEGIFSFDLSICVGFVEDLRGLFKLLMFKVSKFLKNLIAFF